MATIHWVETSEEVAEFDRKHPFNTMFVFGTSYRRPPTDESQTQSQPSTQQDNKPKTGK